MIGFDFEIIQNVKSLVLVWQKVIYAYIFWFRISNLLDRLRLRIKIFGFAQAWYVHISPPTSSDESFGLLWLMAQRIYDEIFYVIQKDHNCSFLLCTCPHLCVIWSSFLVEKEGLKMHHKWPKTKARGCSCWDHMDGYCIRLCHNLSSQTEHTTYTSAGLHSFYLVNRGCLSKSYH